METQRVLCEVEAARRVHEGSPVYFGLYIPGLGPDRSSSVGIRDFVQWSEAARAWSWVRLNAVVYLQRSWKDVWYVIFQDLKSIMKACWACFTPILFPPIRFTPVRFTFFFLFERFLPIYTTSSFAPCRFPFKANWLAVFCYTNPLFLMGI